MFEHWRTYFCILLCSLPISNEKMVREKRDLATVGGAVLQGLIGLTFSQMKQVIHVKSESPGGCDWIGDSPWCWGTCPPQFEFIRSAFVAPGFYDNDTLLKDYSFGHMCFHFLPKKPAPGDCSWGGKWQSSQTAVLLHCKYDSVYTRNLSAVLPGNGNNVEIEQNRCGWLSCDNIHGSWDPSYMKITHSNDGRCDRLQYGMGDNVLHGHARCGLLKWLRNGNVSDLWYKVD